MDKWKGAVVSPSLVKERQLFSADQWFHALIERLRRLLLLNLLLPVAQAAHPGPYLAQPHQSAESGPLDVVHGLLKRSQRQVVLLVPPHVLHVELLLLALGSLHS